ncbi:MAG: SulP family inorganic anion transporter, partial [Planctomycetaceae bacterium]|nr:SulP family inorganic anion transporter [Planctomycetaceae bacterium]
LPASFVVFLVALPLCMGIAIASGVPVAAGLITGIVGGIVVGLIAGSPLQVSGPAAGLTVVVYGIVEQYGLPALGVVVLLGGLLQIAAGLLKLGQWFRAVSPAVIEGMLAGIGVLILASQFHVMVDDKPRSSGLENLLTIPEAVEKGMGIPELGPVERRTFRTEKLKQIGQLHELQVEVQEAIDEHISDHSDEAESHRQATTIAPYIAQQKKITEELAGIVEELDAHGLRADSDQKASTLHLLAVDALEKSREALAQMQADADNKSIEKLFNDRDEVHAVVRVDQTDAVLSLNSLLRGLKNHHWAAFLGLLTIVMIVGWQAIPLKSLKLVPAPLVAVLTTTIVATVWVLPVHYVELPLQLTDSIHYPSLTILNDVPFRVLLQGGIVIALVASAETLLCAGAVDQMHSGQRAQYDRELVAQGVGNSLCGFLGGLPMTGVIVRSAANVQAGATSRWSAVLHGVWLLVFVVFLGSLLQLIPTACLAGMLVYTGYKLCNPKKLVKLWRTSRSEAAIYTATVVGIVTTDLLTGVLIGIGLSVIKLLYLFTHLNASLEQHPEENQATLRLNGTATFIRLPKIAALLDQVQPGTKVRVDLQRLTFIDHACLELLMNWSRQHEATGGQLLMDWDSLHASFQRTPQDADPAATASASQNADGRISSPDHVTA